MASSAARVRTHQIPLPGRPYPLGATWDGAGTNFALFSEHATAVSLCLFDNPSIARERARIPVTETTAHVWHAYLPGVGPGQVYGYRVDGPFDPDQGHWFNPQKLLIDPYARALHGALDWTSPIFASVRGARAALRRDRRNDAAGVPRAVVIDPAFDWGDDRPPATPWERTVIYEVHVKGFTKQHPAIPEDLRGTYAGMAHPAAIEHLTRLGVTVVELLPVHAFADEGHLVRRGLRDYWGYNTIGYFAPAGRYAANRERGGQVAEFKTMVKALHAAGIEVLLDVVYNHTAEGNHLGPTLSWRGIDNTVYYRLVPDRPRYYQDFAGTGNTLDVRHPQVLRLVMDSLRYWVEEMHVDGFRFDLASALARDESAFNRSAPFFEAIHQDPVLSRVKLIAEPWDIAEGGYQTGNYPLLWSEWNDKFRDGVRAFWRGDRHTLGEMGYRLTGSSDLFEADDRPPTASINYVTAHDGFTLEDLVSYEHKHNEANGEHNRDGADHNRSANYGVEGPTTDPAIRAVRNRQKRNFLATLLFSQGVPMLCGGDELGRTQRGNNNAYCQDNEISWFDWDLDPDDAALLAFTRRLVQLRAQHPVLRRRTFFLGRSVGNSPAKDLIWFRPDGEEMSATDWANGGLRAIGLRLAGDAIAETDEQGNRVVDETLLLLLNAEPSPLTFTLPRFLSGRPGCWEELLDTADPEQPELRRYDGGSGLVLSDRSLKLCRRWPSPMPQAADR